MTSVDKIRKRLALRIIYASYENEIECYRSALAMTYMDDNDQKTCSDAFIKADAFIKKMMKS